MNKAIAFLKVSSLLQIEIMAAFVVSSIFNIVQIDSAMGQECSENEAYDPTTGKCDYLFGSCPQGETRGESGYCAPIPLSCSSETRIDEDPICEPLPISEQPTEIKTIQWAQ